MHFGSARLIAADTLQSVQSTAEEMFDTAKDQVASTLQAGQDAIRPARVTRDWRRPRGRRSEGVLAAILLSSVGGCGHVQPPLKLPALQIQA